VANVTPALAQPGIKIGIDSVMTISNNKKGCLPEKTALIHSIKN
jgi:hypothetical protein